MLTRDFCTPGGSMARDGGPGAARGPCPLPCPQTLAPKHQAAASTTQPPHCENEAGMKARERIALIYLSMNRSVYGLSLRHP